VAASAAVRRVRSLFGGKEVGSYDPAAANEKEGGFFSRLFKNQVKEWMAHEVSRTMATIVTINQNFAMRRGACCRSPFIQSINGP